MGKLARHTSAKRESKKEINVARHPTMPNAQCRKPFFQKYCNWKTLDIFSLR